MTPLLDDAVHVAIRLRASVSALMRQLRAQAPVDGPGSARLSVLSHLYRLGALTPTQLAGQERVKLQTLTRLLAELETGGLLLRRPDATDARRTLLSLTPAGAQVLSDEVHRREASLTEALNLALEPGERARLLEACALIDRVTTASGVLGFPAEVVAPVPPREDGTP
jgi:DNA-binding MarR family transcriptional regulator